MSRLCVRLASARLCSSAPLLAGRALAPSLLILVLLGACSPPWPVAEVVTPADGGTVTCDGTGACFFEVRGTLSDPLEVGEELFVAVRPVGEAAARYFIQFGDKTVNGTDWTAQAQIGSVGFPPRAGDVLEIRALVIDTAVAGLPPAEALPDLTVNVLAGLRTVSDAHQLVVTTDGPAQGVLRALQERACWHLYSPYREAAGAPISEAQLRRELQLLYDAGARGLVTYQMMEGVEKAPRIAKELGFEHVLAGVYWWTNGVAHGQTESSLEAEKAAIAASIAWIDGIVIGNEGLIESAQADNQPRYSFADLQRELRAMKAAYPDRLVTTAEGYDSYVRYPALVTDPNLTDFIFPNLHPWWGGARDPNEGVRALVATLASEPFALRGDRLLVMHETWWPSETEGQNENAQRQFFAALREACIPFCWGETIDQPWKVGPEGTVGAHWGLWHYEPAANTYGPKAVVALLSAATCNR